MSHLIHTETGRVIPLLCEPLTTWRRARKTLTLAVTPENEATLYALVWVRAGYTGPLRLAVNGRPLEYRAPSGVHHLHWASLSLPAAWLRRGENVIELWSDATAQAAWSLALESGHAQPGSALSSDGGATWQNERMGLYYTESAEYVVRLRVGAAAPSAPPPMVWENPDAPRLRDVRALIPEAILTIGDPWERARALASHVASAWPYVNAMDSGLYAPWDPATILAWTPEADAVPGYHGPAIRMCVHYAVVFTCLCLASGIPARCIATADSLTGKNGHFVAEVWHAGQWCFIDPNLDIVFLENDRPLSMEEVSSRADALRDLIQLGPGHASQSARLGGFIDESVATGVCFRMYGVWGRNDFLWHPEHTPPSHGQVSYCETAIIWREPQGGAEALGMFPHLAEAGYFLQPPPAPWV